MGKALFAREGDNYCPGSEGSPNLTRISTTTSAGFCTRINFFSHEFRTPTTRASSRLHGALLSKPTSWPMTPRTCHPLHSLPVTTDWMSEVRASPPATAAVWERSLANWSSAVPKSIGKQSSRKSGWQESTKLVWDLAKPPGPSQAPQSRSLLWGSSWSMENTAPWLFYF